VGGEVAGGEVTGGLGAGVAGGAVVGARGAAVTGAVTGERTVVGVEPTVVVVVDGGMTGSPDGLIAYHVPPKLVMPSP